MADDTPPDKPTPQTGDAPQVTPFTVVGTGTPPTSPNFGAPRYSPNDNADYATQTNAVTDTFDAAAAKRGAIVDADIAANAGIQQSKLQAVSAGLMATPGDVKMSAAVSAPPGWLICDGSAVSRVTYAALFSALGGTGSPYGQGDGSTTFNLPNLQGRVPIGVSGSYGRGAVGGEAQHTLSEGEMAAHSHGGSTQATSTDHYHVGTTDATNTDHQHTGSVSGNTAFADIDGGWNHPNTSSGGVAWTYLGSASSGSIGIRNGGQQDWRGWGGNHQHGWSGSFTTSYVSQNQQHQHTFTSAWLSQSGGQGYTHGHGINTDGANTPHNNMQPYQALNFIIKT